MAGLRDVLLHVELSCLLHLDLSVGLRLDGSRCGARCVLQLGRLGAEARTLGRVLELQMRRRHQRGRLLLPGRMLERLIVGEGQVLSGWIVVIERILIPDGVGVIEWIVMLDPSGVERIELGAIVGEAGIGQGLIGGRAVAAQEAAPRRFGFSRKRTVVPEPEVLIRRCVMSLEVLVVRMQMRSGAVVVAVLL